MKLTSAIKETIKEWISKHTVEIIMEYFGGFLLACFFVLPFIIGMSYLFLTKPPFFDGFVLFLCIVIIWIPWFFFWMSVIEKT
jgi:hypothetical protein